MQTCVVCEENSKTCILDSDASSFCFVESRSTQTVDTSCQRNLHSEEIGTGFFLLHVHVSDRKKYYTST
jgi:hypothetical protein